jgi:sugar phosphate isomerase/epimerase
MKIGIDSYCYHRFFEDPPPGQTRSVEKRTLDDLIAKAKHLGVDGLSLETVFMPALDAGFLRELKAKLDAAGLERVLAWGHPHGLEMGSSEDAIASLRAHIPSALAIGANVMRMVCGSFAFFDKEPATVSIERLTPILKELAAEAGSQGVTLAMENHGDFLAADAARLVEAVDSPYFRVTLDTGNNLRLLEDPLEVVRILVPYAVATHLKDIVATGIGSPRHWRTFWPSIGLGNGIIDLHSVLQMLQEAGYSGMLCVEIDLLPFGRTEDQELADSIAFLRRTVPASQ